MMVFLIILAIIIFIALLRFGVALRYNEEGLTVWARVGFLPIKLYPAKKKRVKKKKTDMKVLTELKTKGLKELKALLADLKARLPRIIRRILVKRLEIEYTAAGNDPSKTAITFGRANALAGVAAAVLQDNLRIKHCDFRIFADFESNQQKINLDVVITMAVWEAIYVFFTILPIFSISRTSKAVNIRNIENIRKEARENG